MRLMTSRQAERFAGTWNDTGLWQDVIYLAERFWDSVAEDTAEREIRWHHLLMAIGNFKRQGGTRLLDPLLERQPTRRDRPTSFVAHGQLRVSVDTPGSWRALERGTRGLGRATTTTLLSALWPGDHVIFDRRASNAAVGLVGQKTGWQSGDLPDPDGTTSVFRTWSRYTWFRGHVLDTAQQTEPVMVERALYELDRAINGGADLTWREYGENLRRALR